MGRLDTTRAERTATGVERLGSLRVKGPDLPLKIGTGIPKARLLGMLAGVRVDPDCVVQRLVGEGICLTRQRLKAYDLAHGSLVRRRGPRPKQDRGQPLEFVVAGLPRL
jgi:hypothetical protein